MMSKMRAVLRSMRKARRERPQYRREGGKMLSKRCLSVVGLLSLLLVVVWVVVLVGLIGEEMGRTGLPLVSLLIGPAVVVVHEPGVLGRTAVARFR